MKKKIIIILTLSAMLSSCGFEEPSLQTNTGTNTTNYQKPLNELINEGYASDLDFAELTSNVYLDGKKLEFNKPIEEWPEGFSLARRGSRTEGTLYYNGENVASASFLEDTGEIYKVNFRPSDIANESFTFDGFKFGDNIQAVRDKYGEEESSYEDKDFVKYSFGDGIVSSNRSLDVYTETDGSINQVAIVYRMSIEEEDYSYIFADLPEYPSNLDFAELTENVYYDGKMLGFNKPMEEWPEGFSTDIPEGDAYGFLYYNEEKIGSVTLSSDKNSVVRIRISDIPEKEKFTFDGFKLGDNIQDVKDKYGEEEFAAGESAKIYFFGDGKKSFLRSLVVYTDEDGTIVRVSIMHIKSRADEENGE